MRYVRHVSKIIRGCPAKWEPAPPEAEVDGKTYFWSDDPIFKKMMDGGGLLDRHGNRQWKLKDGKLAHKIDPLSADQKRREEERRFRAEYPTDRAQRIMEEAEEARMDGAPDIEPAIRAFRAMRQRRREIKAEVDQL